MMCYCSEIFFGGSDNVLEWDKPQCIFRFEKKVFLNDPNLHRHRRQQKLSGPDLSTSVVVHVQALNHLKKKPISFVFCLFESVFLLCLM